MKTIFGVSFAMTLSGIIGYALSFIDWPIYAVLLLSMCNGFFVGYGVHNFFEEF